MNAHLMFADVEPEIDQPLPAHADDLRQDLGLDALLDVMAAGDTLLRDIADRTLMAP